MRILGAHQTIAKGFQYAANEAVFLGANTFQFFSRNPRGSSVKTYDPKDLEAFQALRKEYGFGPILAHAPYTMNPAGTKPEVYEFANMVLREDVARMDAIGIEYLVFHPGSHVGAGVEAGIQRIIPVLNQAVTGEESITVLLETMSGKGSEVGFQFEQLRAILDGQEHPERFGVLMDLCHVFSAGYDIVDDLDGVLAEFDRIIGLEKLKFIHVNDSMMPFGSHKDRHAAIGAGEIGLEAILRVLKHPLLKDLPMVLETPHEPEGHKAEIAMLKEKLGEQ